MKKILTQEDFIALVAERAKFTQKDIKIIFDVIISIFEEAVRNNIIIKLKNFGRLYFTLIPSRGGKDGIIFPSAYRVGFKLAENIRYAKKRVI